MRRIALASLTTGALVTAMAITGIAQNGGEGNPITAKDSAVPCEVTRPNGRGPIQTPNNFYGNGLLAVDLWPNGTIVFRPGGGGFVNRDGSLGIKFAWWRGVQGKLTVDGRRLDTSIASHPRVESQPDDYPEAWLPSYLIFPTPGCWEVTGRIGEASLTFVTRVIKIGDGPTWRRDEPEVRSPVPKVPLER